MQTNHREINILSPFFRVLSTKSYIPWGFKDILFWNTFDHFQKTLKHVFDYISHDMFVFSLL